MDRTGRADGNGVLLMPSMWNEGSYAELEARLIDLQEYERSLWWHVCHRYRFGTTRIILAPVIRRIRYGQREPTVSLPKRCELVAGVPVHEVQAGSRLARCRICEWSEQVRPELVAEGVDVLTTTMYDGRHDRIWLPAAVYDRLTAKAIAA